MDKIYRVFVSSTYEDLIEERQEVMQVLLRLNCIPSGMELFPAADKSKWDLIKKVIDDCDYFITIVAGRYGTEGLDGKSYTQMEYEYAFSQGKPILRFLHGDPDSLPANKMEQTVEGRQKLKQFRANLQAEKFCKDWLTSAGLGRDVTIGLTSLMQESPSIGLRNKEYLKPLRKFWEPFLNENEVLVIMSTRPGENPWNSYRVSFNEVDAFLNSSIICIDLGIKPKLEKSNVQTEMFRNKNIILMGSPVANRVTERVWKKLSGTHPFEFIIEPYETTITIDGKEKVIIMNNHYFKYTKQDRIVEYRPELDKNKSDPNKRWIKDYGIIMRHRNPFSYKGNVMALAMGCHGVSTDGVMKLMANGDFIEKKLAPYCKTNFIVLIEFDLDDGDVIYNQDTPKIIEVCELTD
jgi:hypothetical protein